MKCLFECCLPVIIYMSAITALVHFGQSVSNYGSVIWGYCFKQGRLTDLTFSVVLLSHIMITSALVLLDTGNFTCVWKFMKTIPFLIGYFRYAVRSLDTFSDGLFQVSCKITGQLLQYFSTLFHYFWDSTKSCCQYYDVIVSAVWQFYFIGRSFR